MAEVPEANRRASLDEIRVPAGKSGTIIRLEFPTSSPCGSSIAWSMCGAIATLRRDVPTPEAGVSAVQSGANHAWRPNIRAQRTALVTELRAPPRSSPAAHRERRENALIDMNRHSSMTLHARRARGASRMAEARLVFATAGGAASEEIVRTLVPRVADWSRLLRLSLAEGAYPVFATRLLQANETLPADVAGILRGMERRAGLRQLHLQRRLLDALSVLESAGIPVMLLKGAAIAHATHRSFSTRPMADVDLLIAPGRAAQAFECLTNAGWVRSYPDAFDGWYETMHHLPPLVDARARALDVGLEIHTDLIHGARNPFAFSANDLWRDAIPAEGLSSKVYVPGIEHRLLHCCIHFAWLHRMRIGAWKSFADVRSIADEGRIDWEAFVRLVRRSRASACCYWTLQLAQDLACASVPHHVIDTLRPARAAVVLRALERHFIHGLAENEWCPSPRLEGILWRMGVRPDPDEHGVAPRWTEDERDWRVVRHAARQRPEILRAASGASMLMLCSPPPES